MPEPLSGWAEIPGFSGRYHISVTGQIVSFARPKIAFLTPRYDRAGYQWVELQSDGGATWPRINRLALMSFVGAAPSPEHEGAHLNGVKDDNRIDNLAWKTSLENAQDKHAHGTTVMGERQHLAKLTEIDVVSIRRLFDGSNAIPLAEKFGVTNSNILFIVKRKTWKHVA